MHRVVARVKVDCLVPRLSPMKAQPILLGVAIAGIAASIGYVSAVDLQVSSNTASSDAEIPSAVSSFDSATDVAQDSDASLESSDSALQSKEPSVRPSAAEPDSTIATAPSDPNFDADTGNTSVTVNPSCSDAVTQTDMNICAHQTYETVDVALNQTYQALTAELSASDQELLTDAELAWIEYRDRTCELEAASYEGGSIQPLIHSQCLTRITENRTAELQAHLNELNSR